MNRRPEPLVGPCWPGRRVSRRRCLTLLAAGTTLPFMPRRARAEDMRFFRIGTGPTGASYFPVGGLLASIISNPPGSRSCEVGGSCGVPGLIAVAQTSQGSVENVREVGAGRLDSGLCQADIAYWAYTGANLFRKQGAQSNLRAIANLFQETLHVVVRRDAGINSIGQLKGMRVSLGDEGSGTLVTARQVLAACHLTEKQIKPSFVNAGTAAEMMRAGNLDAFFLVSGAPVALMTELANALPIDLLPVGDDVAAALRRDYPFLAVAVIPPNTYLGTAETRTLGIGAIWVVSAALDDSLAFGITAALWHPSTRKMLDELPLGQQIRFETAVVSLPIPLHPGAERYYAEAMQQREKQSKEVQQAR